MVLARIPILPGFDTPKMDSPRQRVRRAWLDLQEPGLHMGSPMEESQNRLQELLSHHKFALDDLVSAGEMDKEAARQVQTAYRAAVLHTGRTGISRVRCKPDSTPLYEDSAAGQLVKQTGILSGMATRGVISPESASEAQRVISRAMALITTAQEDPSWLSDAVDGANDGYPTFDELPLQVSPASQAAARFLGDVLLVGTPG